MIAAPLNQLEIRACGNQVQPRIAGEQALGIESVLQTLIGHGENLHGQEFLRSSDSQLAQ